MRVAVRAKSGSAVKTTRSLRARGVDVPIGGRNDVRMKSVSARCECTVLARRAAQVATSSSDGLQARDVAVSALFSVLVEKRPSMTPSRRWRRRADLAPRDRAFARLIATTVLRNRGSLQAVLNTYLAKPLPEHQGRLEQILLAAVAQLLLLQTPPHAAISLAVDQCRADELARRFANLVNAVLRRASESGGGRLASLDNVALTIPDWLLSRWTRVYGATEARQIARASLSEPPLDLTVKSDPEIWAERLGGIVLPNGSVRCAGAGRIEELEGYAEGAWWVQDAAAALPVKLFGDVAGLDALDLCAAPGGKAAQLAAGRRPRHGCRQIGRAASAIEGQFRAAGAHRRNRRRPTR